MDQPNKNPKQPSIEISNETAQGVYSNLARIAHTPTEVVLDFAQQLPGNPNFVVRSRVIMSPVHAKYLLKALHDNLEKYESTFGAIVEPRPNNDTIEYDMDMVGKA